MALIVVALDVVEIHRVLDSRHLVQLARVRPNRGIVDDTPFPGDLRVVTSYLFFHASGEIRMGGAGIVQNSRRAST